MKRMLVIALMLATPLTQAMTMDEARDIVKQIRFVECDEGHCHYVDTGEYYADGPDGTLAVAPLPITGEQMKEAAVKVSGMKTQAELTAGNATP